MINSARRFHPHAGRRPRIQQSHNGAGEAAGTNSAPFPNFADPTTSSRHRRLRRQRFLRSGLRSPSENSNGYGRLIDYNNTVSMYHHVICLNLLIVGKSCDESSRIYWSRAHSIIHWILLFYSLVGRVLLYFSYFRLPFSAVWTHLWAIIFN